MDGYVTSRSLQALKNCKHGERLVLAPFIEHELAVTCQYCAKGLLRTVLVCSKPHESVAAASNMLRRALDIHKKELACRSIVPRPCPKEKKSRVEVPKSTVEHEICSQVVGIMQTWRLPPNYQTEANVVADTHLLLMQAASLQMQVNAKSASDRCVAIAAKAVGFKMSIPCKFLEHACCNGAKCPSCRVPIQGDSSHSTGFCGSTSVHQCLCTSFEMSNFSRSFV
jgi:hypothetical protein